MEHVRQQLVSPPGDLWRVGFVARTLSGDQLLSRVPVVTELIFLRLLPEPGCYFKSRLSELDWGRGRVFSPQKKNPFGFKLDLYFPFQSEM